MCPITSGSTTATSTSSTTTIACCRRASDRPWRPLRARSRRHAQPAPQHAFEPEPAQQRQDREDDEVRAIEPVRLVARVGVPRILKLLGRYGVKASFYVPAVSALI